MTNPFDDLESDDTDESSEPDAQEDAEASAIESSPTEPSEPEPEPDAELPPSETGPAFEYSEVRQRPLYARDKTWSEFEKTFRTRIGPKLAEADVVDEEMRETHDAVLRLAIEEPDRVAELLLEARRNS
ncbi:hypothetical protein [Natronorubrum daqingense]|uniref:Uncharacterized protein n=1 Tax=Natronorubrum daqingense TaxID=588898 RepID=A0A1N7G5I3_9EURY|nr:hypothetical protein [Natronorubrum daqingense]APX98713.1 hypothetical protein BB347_18575 [Natronorubrum daqingense]SIS07867.1 hypothetical protein SAMN05421809_3747 [Natronorubrum daqingense]